MSSKKMPQRSGAAAHFTAAGSTVTTAGAAASAGSTIAAKPPLAAADAVSESDASQRNVSHVTSAHGFVLSGSVSRNRRTFSPPVPANASGTVKRRFSLAFSPPTYQRRPTRRATTAYPPIFPWRKRVSSNVVGISRQKSRAESFSLIWPGCWYQKRNWNPLE